MIAKLVALFAGVLGSFWLGAAWERSRCYDGYIYWFCRYSAHLHELAEHQKMEELTNSIALFDSVFRPHQDAETLQNVMYEMLKVGRFYPSGTNEALGSNLNK